MFVTLSFGELGPNESILFATEPETTASGLLWLSELIEEHSRIAKIVGKKGIYVCSLRYKLSLRLSPLNSTGYNLDTHIACAHRCPPLSQDCIFDILPCRILAKCLALMARHFPFLIIIHRILHPRRRGPFHVVLPFYTHHTRGSAGSAQNISWRAGGKDTHFWRHGDVFWAVRVADSVISFPQPERQR